jgi:hypothetical protein
MTTFPRRDRQGPTHVTRFLQIQGSGVDPRSAAGYNHEKIMRWHEILHSTVKGESITASSLRKVPHLKTCPYWDRAVFMGRISHRLQFANYDGGLVKYDGKVYYVNRSQIEALSSYIRWDLKKQITVIEG